VAAAAAEVVEITTELLLEQVVAVVLEVALHLAGFLH
jgi:hypothetical protein